MDANYTFASMHNLAKSEQIAAIAFRTELFQLGQISQLIWTEHTWQTLSKNGIPAKPKIIWSKRHFKTNFSSELPKYAL